MLKMFELSPIGRQKSFYGKAKVVSQCDKSTNHCFMYTLYSYDTPVLRINSDRNTIERLWSGYSATTMKHVNAFMDWYGLSSYGGKAWWDALPLHPVLF